MRGARRHLRGARHHRRPRGRCCADLDHPFAAGEPVYDVTFENVQAGLRTDYLFRLANQHGGIVLGTGDLSRAGARLVHLRRRRPDVALQRQRRRAEDADPAPDPLGDRAPSSSTPRSTRCCSTILDTEITPELFPTGEGEKPQSTEATIGPYALQDFTLFHVLRYGFRPAQDRLPGAGTPGTTPRPATGRPGFPPTSAPAYDLAAIRHWLEVFCAALLRVQPVQALGAAERAEGQPGGSLSPRGDWRAPSDLPARIWLEEIRTQVPDA